MTDRKASLNYVAGDERDHVPFLLDRDWSGANPEKVQISLIDGGNQPPSLDEEGFGRFAFDHPVVDFSDQRDLEEKWMPAVADLVRRSTGASWVVCWAPNVRYSTRLAASGDSPVAAPAPIVHSDQTPEFDVANLAHQPLGANAGAEIARRVGPGNAPKRWRIFNVWQQISQPPADYPLALCDLRSVAHEDIVEGHGKIAPDDPQVFKLTFYRAGSAHRWFYFPDLSPREALIFSGLDLAEPHTQGRVPHSAVKLPESPQQVPRNSIEVRTLAVFED